MKFLYLILLSVTAIIYSNNNDCYEYISLQENIKNIPKNLLKSISLVESGRKVNGKFIAWPWTINVEGKGYVFKTKKEAIDAVKKHIKQGKTSIDVGAMQINLKHHPHAFKSLEDAFDPQINIAYGAKYLKELYKKTGNWNDAVAYYHSASPKFHNKYRKNVMKQWSNLAKVNNEKNITNTVLKDNNFIKPYAKIKRVYYTIEGGENKHSQIKNSNNTTQRINNGRTYYSLD